MGLEELEKNQQDLKETMYQLKEMMTGLIKERGIIEGPNLQEGLVQEKIDNQKRGYLSLPKLVSSYAYIKPYKIAS